MCIRDSARIAVAEVEAALDRAPAVAPTAEPAWERALADWADARLAEGASDLHAQARDALDRVLMATALARTGGHRGQASERLGVGRNTLTRKLGASRTRRR